jgi:hypothetical protein
LNTCSQEHDASHDRHSRSPGSAGESISSWLDNGRLKSDDITIAALRLLILTG